MTIKMGKTCRCCLSGDGEEPIFHKMEVGDCQEITYSDMLTAITSNKVLASDGLPREICYNCSRELKQAYKFRMKCDKAYETLMLLKTSHRIPVVLVKQTTSRSPQADNSNEEFDDIFVDEDVDKDSDGDVKTIKVELDVEDNGFMYIEPLDDTGDVENSIKDDIKPETDAVTEDLERETNASTNQSTSSINTCPVCAENFRFKSNLKNHIKKMHPDYKSDSYFCEICEKTYSNGPRHNRKRHRNEKRQYNCSLCDEKFQSSQTLGTHMEEHKVNGLFKCKDCPLLFSNTGPYYKHVMIHREKKHLCHICSMSFVYKYGLTVHMRKHTNEKPYACPICKKTFKTGNLRNYHMENHTDIENLDEKTLAEYLELKLQLSQKESIGGRRRKTKNKCNECDKTFKRRRDLEDHMNRHLGIKPYFCELCNKHFFSERRHKYTHKIKNVDSTCPVCSKKLNTKSALTLHMRIHTKDKRYHCTMCDARFTQVTPLNLHILRHNNEKNFICHVCSKAFISKYKLAIHIRTHTQERPYPCDLCPKKFMTGNQLRTHKQRHQDERTLPCELCDKAFKTKNDLRAHLRVHEKIRKHPCHLCDKVFYRSDHRQRHERTVHCMNTKNELGANTSQRDDVLDS